MSISTTYKKSDLIWSILTEEIGFYGRASSNSIVHIVALLNNATIGTIELVEAFEEALP